MSVKTLLLGLSRIFGSTLNLDLIDDMVKFKQHKREICSKCGHNKCLQPDCKYNICICETDSVFVIKNIDKLMFVKQVKITHISRSNYEGYTSYELPFFVKNDQWNPHYISDIIKSCKQYELLKPINRHMTKDSILITNDIPNITSIFLTETIPFTKVDISMIGQGSANLLKYIGYI